MGEVGREGGPNQAVAFLQLCRLQTLAPHGEVAPVVVTGGGLVARGDRREIC